MRNGCYCHYKDNDELEDYEFSCDFVDESQCEDCPYYYEDDEDGDW